MYRKQAVRAVGHVLAEHRVAAWAVDRCRQQAEIDPSILNVPRIELSARFSAACRPSGSPAG
jgi:hypothetical protein